jgi:hypothetical protein
VLASRLRPSTYLVLRSLAMVAAASVVGCTPGPEGAFVDHAAPVLERRCATTACHGVRVGEALPDVGFFVSVDAEGRLSDLRAARERARARVTTTAPAHLSSLLRVPLARAHAGGPHAGGELFTGPDDAAARSIARWVDAEPEGTGGEDVALTELELRFEADVLPTLVRRCAIAGCHGPREVANTAFPARRDPSTGAFAPIDVRRTRRVARKFIDLWGARVEGSRLFRKALGASAGLGHRGGPGSFFPEAPTDRPFEAPALERMLDWARAERSALGVDEGRTPAGVVVVRQPIAARVPYRIEPEREGSALLFLPWPLGSAPAEPLAPELASEGPVELRDPAVAHDGRTLAFAMRRVGEPSFALYELDLRDRGVRRVTPEGIAGSFVSPVYGPDGRLVAAWDGHGEAGTDGEGVAPELVAIDADGHLERLTWTRSPEVRPGVLSAGKTRGMIVFGTRRAGPSGGEGVLFRFPPCHDPTLHGEPEYHVQFGASIAPAAPHVARDLPDGRQIVTVLPSTEAGDDRGALAVLDRSLGPALPAGAGSSVPGRIEPLSLLDAEARWRDPAPLPDGRVLASTDRGRPEGEDALVIATITDGPGGATLGEIETILAEPGFAIRGAAVVIARPIEDDDHTPVIDTARRDARIAIRDARVLEALYGRPEPTGARPLRDDLHAVRLLVPAETRGARGPGARVLAEVPFAADRSAELSIPARTPVLLQWLDARGMVIGRQLDRWYYGEGGELVPAGTNPETYAHDCAGCHGALSGDPVDATGPAPDVLTAASVTLSTHEGRDRHLPLAPFDATTLAPVEATFEALVAPILASRCTRCHDGEEPAGGLTLSPGAGARFDRAYEALVDEALVGLELRARRSPLVERLLGTELDAPGTPTGSCPPEGLSPTELRDVCRWIEAGAAFSEVADAP